MTNEERELAIYCLKASNDFYNVVCEECKKYPNCDHFQQDELMEKVIKALEAQPCEDAISRQAVKEAIMDCETFYEDRMDTFIEDTTVLEVKIDNLPSATPTRPHGKWIWYEVNGVDYCKCDRCNNGAWEMEFDFCSYCGADMSEVKADEL